MDHSTYRTKGNREAVLAFGEKQPPSSTGDRESRSHFLLTGFHGMSVRPRSA